MSPINTTPPPQDEPEEKLALPAGMTVDLETGELSTVSDIVKREMAQLPADLSDLRELFVAKTPEPREVMAWIMARETMEEIDPEDAQLQIIARILMSETAEEVLAQDEVLHAQDVLEQPFRFEKVTWQRSTQETGSACYAVFHVRYPGTDKPAVITTGAKNVMVQALKMDMIKAFPFDGRITKKQKATQAGYHPLYLTHL